MADHAGAGTLKAIPVSEAKYDLSAQPKPVMLKGNLEHKEPKKDKKTGDSKKPCGGKKKKPFQAKAEKNEPKNDYKADTGKADPGKAGPHKGGVSTGKPGGPLKGGADHKPSGPLKTGTSTGDTPPHTPPGHLTPMTPHTAPVTPPHKPPQKPPLKGTLTKDEARDRFKELAGKKDYIPFDYPDDCCYSRANEMCRLLEAQGIATDKIWIFEPHYYWEVVKENHIGPAPPQEPLVAYTKNHPRGRVAWGYHVATVVQVQGPGGTVQPMVIDPSLFDRPVTPLEWYNSMNNPHAIVGIGHRDWYFPNRGKKEDPGAYDPDYSQTKQQLQMHVIERAHRRIDLGIH